MSMMNSRASLPWRLDTRRVADAALGDRHRGIRALLLEHGLPGELEVGAELGLEDAQIEQRAVVEGDLPRTLTWRASA
jgi:hypothetical protein